MRVNILTSFLAIMLSISAAGQKSENTAEKIIDENFCELLKHPDEYKNKLVRVKATYQSFFEVSMMCCSDCLQQRGTWVETNAETYREKSKKNLPKKIIRGCGRECDVCR